MRFAFPQRSSIIVILLLTLAVVGPNAVELLILKYSFDGLKTDDAISVLGSDSVSTTTTPYRMRVSVTTDRAQSEGTI